jgi:hypothetical protein
MASVAAAVAAEFPAAHAPDVARKLLLTAATRVHASAVMTLASCDAMLQHLDVGTVESVLEQLINDLGCFEMICELPVASQLDSAAVARLLQAALQQGGSHCLHSLLAFPAAEQFRADMIVQLLYVLLKCEIPQLDWFAAKLCMLQAAQQLRSSVVEQLLLAAIESSINGSSDICMKALCGLPAASQLGGESVARLLLAGVKQNSRGWVYWLCRLPGLQQADSAALETMIEEALLDQSFAVPAFLVHSLLRLPAAAQLSITAMVRLLNAALACKYPDCMRLLLAHPMARQLSSDVVAQLLQAACTQGKVWYTAQLCRLPAAANISNTKLVSLLEAAAGNPQCVEELLRLPGAKLAA